MYFDYDQNIFIQYLSVYPIDEVCVIFNVLLVFGYRYIRKLYVLVAAAAQHVLFNNLVMPDVTEEPVNHFIQRDLH